MVSLKDIQYGGGGGAQVVHTYLLLNQPTYFHDGPNRFSHCTKVWRKTYLISHASLLRSAQRS